jgi:hypothetical protein
MSERQRHVLDVAAATLIAALMGSAPALSQEKNVGAIDLAVRVIPASGSDSGRIFLDMVLRNTSESQLFFTEQNQDWDYQIEILGPDNSPLELTNYGKCVLPQPSTILRSILWKLEPGEKDHIETVELNRLFKLDRAGRHRVVVRRGVWQVPVGSPRLTVKYFLFDCRPPTACGARVVVSSGTMFVTVPSPYPDLSPQADPARCR